MSEKENSAVVLFDFVDATEARLWFAINDNVMGGVSKGIVSADEDSSLLFSGSISLENNGGFASIRSQPTDFGLSWFGGIRIRVKGDGRSYQFRIRTDCDLDNIAYKHEFSTIKNEWMEIELPFRSFIPTHRGKTLTNVKPLRAEDIRQLGFLIADKKVGPFSLLVDKIMVFK